MSKSRSYVARMIHVCPLSSFLATVGDTGRAPHRHAVAAHRPGAAAESHIAPPTISSSAWTTSTSGTDGGHHRPGATSTSQTLVGFVGTGIARRRWWCGRFAGISRSTAGAYVRLRAQSASATVRRSLRLSATPRAHAQHCASSRSPTACSSATAAWCARSRPSATVPPPKATRSGSISNNRAFRPAVLILNM